MPSFFTSLFDIDQHASVVKRRYSLCCEHCGQVGHLIAHGFVYKQLSIVKRECVGKRLVCCPRFGHNGCGRTMQLSLSRQLPRRFYSAWQLSMFIVLLLSNMAVTTAYVQATGQSSTRQAWRWLAALALIINSRGAPLARGCIAINSMVWRHSNAVNLSDCTSTMVAITPPMKSCRPACTLILNSPMRQCVMAPLREKSSASLGASEIGF